MGLVSIFCPTDRRTGASRPPPPPRSQHLLRSCAHPRDPHLAKAAADSTAPPSVPPFLPFSPSHLPPLLLLVVHGGGGYLRRFTAGSAPRRRICCLGASARRGCAVAPGGGDGARRPRCGQRTAGPGCDGAFGQRVASPGGERRAGVTRRPPWRCGGVARHCSRPRPWIRLTERPSSHRLLTEERGILFWRGRLAEMHETERPARTNCPGTQSEDAGKADACAGCPNQQICATAPKGPDPDVVAIVERMAMVKHKILVLSGKGGVGKSTFSAQLSFALAEMEHQVGLLDIDICGPSIPKMLGLEGQDIHQSNLGWSPVYVESNLGVMSIGFMLPNPDDAVIWRGPRKNGLIKQFLKDVDWGEIDYLVVDAPPGTSDEHISIVQYLQATGIDGAIIVTTPQQVSLIDVRKEINFCKKVGVPVLGVVENMSGLRQPLSDLRFVKLGESGETDATEWALNCIREKAPELLSVVACSDVFDSSKGGAEKMCIEMGVPFLGKVPMDPQLCKAAEEGRSCFADQKCSASAPALQSIVKKLIKPE